MSENREYEKEYKVQAVKLAKQIGSTKAAEELNTGQYAVRMDEKSKIGRIGYRMRRTQSGGISEYCGRKSAVAKTNQGIGKRKQTTA